MGNKFYLIVYVAMLRSIFEEAGVNFPTSGHLLNVKFQQ